MTDSVISLLSWVAMGTGAIACVGSVFLAARQPDQRKAHLLRAGFFGAIAATMLALR